MTIPSPAVVYFATEDLKDREAFMFWHHCAEQWARDGVQVVPAPAPQLEARGVLCRWPRAGMPRLMVPMGLVAP